MTPDDLKSRTKAFAVRVVKLYGVLPKSTVAQIVGKQLLRSATSVGANYRAACRARSAAEFASRMGVVEEEADECCYWMELLTESGILPVQRIQLILEEAGELCAMAASSRKTAKRSSTGIGAKRRSVGPSPNRQSEIDHRQSPGVL